VGAKNSSYTTVCSGERRRVDEIEFFLFILFHVLTHLEDKLENFYVTFVFNSTIAFSGGWLKPTISHVLNPCFHQCLF